MAFDYKKEFPEFYKAKESAIIVSLPAINFLYTDSADGEAALISFAKFMRTKKEIAGYFEYVLPPLEKLYMKKNTRFIIRLPEFFRNIDIEEALKEKGISDIGFFRYEEGFSVQILKTGTAQTFTKEKKILSEYAERYGYKTALDERFIHEIFIGKERRIIRLPISL